MNARHLCFHERVTVCRSTATALPALSVAQRGAIYAWAPLCIRLDQLLEDATG